MIILLEFFPILFILLKMRFLISILKIWKLIIISRFILKTLFISLILSLFVIILIIWWSILLALIAILLIKLIFILFHIFNSSIAIFVILVLILIFKINIIFISIFLLFIIFSVSLLRLIRTAWTFSLTILSEIVFLRMFLWIILIIKFVISFFYIICVHSFLCFLWRKIKCVAFLDCETFVERFFTLIRNEMGVIGFLMDCSKRSNRSFKFSCPIKFNNNRAFFAFMFIVYLLSTSRKSQRFTIWANSFWKCILIILSLKIWVSFIFFIDFSLENIRCCENKLRKHTISFFESLEPAVPPHCFLTVYSLPV